MHSFLCQVSYYFFHLFICFCLIGKRHAYSNLGYTILGQVIERVTGQAYEEFMVRILKSVEVSHMKIGRTRKKDLDTNEVRIYIRESSFNMTRGGGDEDIKGGAPKIFRHPKGGL